MVSPILFSRAQSVLSFVSSKSYLFLMETFSQREGRKIKIDTDACTGCFICIPYCPMAAIKEDKASRISSIDQDECVECGACLRSDVCPTDAIYWPELGWPRGIRKAFSAVVSGYGILEKVGIQGYTANMVGRGTSEMKTNDTTGRFKEGEVGIGAEIGRPGVGFRFKDLEKVTMAMKRLGVEPEPHNPVLVLLDPETGRIKHREIVNERAISAIIEMKVNEENALEVIDALHEVAKQVDTVITIDIINKCTNGIAPFKTILEEAGYKPRFNGKTNMGLGRPLAS